MISWEHHQQEGPAPCLARSEYSAHLSSAVRRLLPLTLLEFTSPEFVPLPQVLKVIGDISRSKMSTPPLHHHLALTLTTTFAHTSLKNRLNIQRKTQAHTFWYTLFRAEKNKSTPVRTLGSLGHWAVEGAVASILALTISRYVTSSRVCL